jgi:CBS domain-containing protein
MRPEEPISNVMTDAVVVIEADRPVSEALACFQQYPIHHLPVVRGGRLAGMLSSADLMKLEFFAPRGPADRTQFLDARFSIEQIMRAPVASRGPRASVAEVAAAIIDAGVHAMPIVDEDDRVLGLVSTTDLIRSLLRGPPRRGNGALQHESESPPQDEAPEGRSYHRRPTDAEFAIAMETAELLHVEARDPKFLGKTLLYLDQRRAYLEKVLTRADRFLVAGQDEHNHALLLKAVLAAKRAEEHAAGTTRVPFPLE